MANAEGSKSTWTTPENTAGFGGCQSPHSVPGDFIDGLLAANAIVATLTQAAGVAQLVER